MELPKYDNSSKKGEDGLTIVKSIVESDLKWIFRKNHQEVDFGIDAYIDVISEFGNVTGKSIALQIKTGESYFTESNEFGWVFRGEMKHLNYYLNHQIPVIIVLVNDKTKTAYWTLCDPNKTIKAGENWKITVLSSQKLSESSKNELSQYISPTTDYVSQLEHFWKVNKLLMNNERILFIVDKKAIEKGNHLELISGFNRIQANTDLIGHLKGRVEVTIHGYDDDPRELFQIEEVMQWGREIFNKIEGWVYYLDMNETGHFLKVLFLAHAKFELTNVDPIKQKNYVKFDVDHSATFMYSLFDNLNAFCDKHNISEETNKELSEKMLEYFADDI
jgi:hypothetical protein